MLDIQALSLVSKPELKPIEKASASAESVSLGKRDIWLAKKMPEAVKQSCFILLFTDGMTFDTDTL